MEPIRALLAAAHAVLLSVGGLTATAVPPATGHTMPPATASAPYYRVLAPGAPDPRTVMRATGQATFVMAFILARGRRCAAAWNGGDPVAADTKVAALIAGIREGGGDAAASAGGHSGTKLGQACLSAPAAAAAYQRVISAYRLRALDFDLEQPEIRDRAAVRKELGAARILQRANPGLSVSVTLPGVRTGASDDVQELLNQARALELTPDDYTLMPFDDHVKGGAGQVTALKDFHAQLMKTFGWNSAQAYAREGFSGMNGRTDDGEYFRQADFRTVLTFARQAGLARFTFWSVNRDRQCDKSRPSEPCSGVSQRAWDFTRITADGFPATAGRGGAGVLRGPR